ncbi:MerR family transcriptional regulator [Occallatibacter riparius]|uniref:MerR family transcriptional regulator n=1 Tax=Occallatibacter riparius TaxID=1002689 RepID=A0A9J7BU51_9BACT|nr:MerR family transcriptional regulator [Occallatibacter riparius]UWZ86113.1 MerR family transcriptional regulator [Occallatibacter riparius]
MAQASRKHASDTPVIPDRLYFKIGDVARICGIETYVLRFWETQFPQLKPNKSGTGQRLYRRRDVELALEIQRLVHKEGYTISGARHALEGGVKRVTAPAQAVAEPATEPPPMMLQRNDTMKAALVQARNELREISQLLDNPQPTARRERAKVIKVRPELESLFPM